MAARPTRRATRSSWSALLSLKTASTLDRNVIVIEARQRCAAQHPKMYLEFRAFFYVDQKSDEASIGRAKPGALPGGLPGGACDLHRHALPCVTAIRRLQYVVAVADEGIGPSQ